MRWWELPDGLARAAFGKRVRWVRTYTGLGWPICAAAYLRGEECSCGRARCPAPGLHPISEPTTAAGELVRLLRQDPERNLMVATGSAVDAVQVPVPLGRLAAATMPRAGPLASAGHAYVFFVSTGSRVPPAGVYWYSAGAHVLMPPSVVPRGHAVSWIHGPDHPLPDAATLAGALGHG